MIIWLAAMLGVPPGAADVPHCSVATAERATVGEIQRRPDRFLGRCVTVRGPTDGMSVYASEGARARARRLLRVRGTPTEPDPRQRLGIYTEFAGRDPGPDARWAITGIVDDCDAMYERAQAEAKRKAVAKTQEEDAFVVIMMTGYCHYLSGPVIHAVAVERLPERTR